MELLVGLVAWSVLSIPIGILAGRMLRERDGGER